MTTIFTVKLPDIGEGVAEGEVIEWLKQPGDSIEQDEPVVVVMTDKATVELPAPKPGKLAKQYYKPGDKAPVNKPLYDIELNVAAKIEKTKEEKTPEVKQKPLETKHAAVTGSKLALPQTRHIAKELGIDIESIPATGSHGEVTVEDIKLSLKAKSAPITRLPGDAEQSLIGVRKLMAQRMALSKKNIPHFSYFEQIDAVRLVQLRDNIKRAAANEGIKATYMPFFIRALSMTIEKFPIINSSFDANNSKVILHTQHNIGIAMTIEHGLIVPVLKNVQDMKLQEIIRAYDALVKKAQNNSLTSTDMKDGTITISNYGVHGGGGRWATPIINFPETVILAVARIQKQPMIKNEEIQIRDALNLSWSFDHRIIDGELGAEASHYFGTLIANPAPLL